MLLILLTSLKFFPFNNETIKKINFDNFDYNNIPSIADEWWNHQALNY